MIPARMRPGTFREGADKGTTDAPFWIYQNIGALAFFAFVGNIIHFMTTTDIKRDEDGSMTGVDWGEGLPANRYIPYEHRGWSKLGYGYNPEYLSPDIPFETRSGDRAMLDLLGQYDFVFRMLDGGFGLPFVGGINARLGTTPRYILSQMKEKDFKGRDIAKWGFLQKQLQGIYDLFGPIGAGQLSVGLAQAKWGDTKLPTVSSRLGTLIAPGATLSDILPEYETRISEKAQLLQAMGWNVKALTNEALKDKMVFKLFGRGEYPGYEGVVIKSWEDLKKHEAFPILVSHVMNSPDNIVEVEELNLRREEGYEDYYDDTGKMLAEIREARTIQNQDHRNTVEVHALMLFDPNDNTAWSPKRFLDGMKDDNKKYRTRVEQIQKTYGHDPYVLMDISAWKEEPDRATAPLEWAIWQFNDMRAKHTDIRGEVDWDAFNTAWEKEMAGWDDPTRMETGGVRELFLRFQDERIKFHNPQQNQLVMEYKQGIDYLNKMGYWQDGPKIDRERSDIPNGRIVYVEDNFLRQMESLQRRHGDDLATNAQSAWSVWSRYLKSSPEERARLRSQSRWSVKNVIDVMEHARATHRYQIGISDDRVDKTLIKWFRNSPYRMSNAPYYQRLYGKLPGTIRKLPR